MPLYRIEPPTPVIIIILPHSCDKSFHKPFSRLRYCIPHISGSLDDLSSVKMPQQLRVCRRNIYHHDVCVLVSSFKIRSLFPSKSVPCHRRVY